MTEIKNRDGLTTTLTGMQMDRRIDWQTDRQTDGQMDRQADRQSRTDG